MARIRVKEFLKNILFSQSLINFVVNSNEKMKEINNIQEELISIKNKKISIYDDFILKEQPKEKDKFLLKREIESLERKEEVLIDKISEIKLTINKSFKEIKTNYEKNSTEEG